jgi:hypothetical protein
MQFHHAHGFRAQVGQVLQEEWPAAFAAWMERGAEPITFDVPGVGPVPGGHRSRRDTFERALRATSDEVAGLSLVQGHVDGVVSSGGRVRGLVVDGRPLDADLVVDASGRSGRATDHVRAPSGTGGPCGMAYVDRQYRLRDGAEPGPMTNPLFWQADFDGYQAIVFLHERGHFSVLLVRPTADPALKGSGTRLRSTPPARPFPDWPSGPTRGALARSRTCCPVTRSTTPTEGSGGSTAERRYRDW